MYSFVVYSLFIVASVVWRFCVAPLFCVVVLTLDRRQSKTLILTTNVDQKSLETEFSIAFCRPTGDKWQWKTLFLAIFDSRSSIVKNVVDCRLSNMVLSVLSRFAIILPRKRKLVA